MSLFFSPKVNTYSILANNSQACGIVDGLIATAYVQFQLSPYEDQSGLFYLMYSRIKLAKFRVSAILVSIQNKYGETVTPLTSEQRLRTIRTMKAQMQQQGQDYLRHLDGQQDAISAHISRFHTLSSHFDLVVSSVDLLQEEIETVESKIEVISQRGLGDEFVIITGACPIANRYSIERVLFRKTQGHCLTIFRSRQNSPKGILICLIHRGVYRHTKAKIETLLKCNQVTLYQLPNEHLHLQGYLQQLRRKLAQYRQLLLTSTNQFTRLLRDCLTVSGDGQTGRDGHQAKYYEPQNMQEQMVRLAFLERILYIVCHSKQVGNPPNHVLFTIHVPAEELLPELPVPILAVSGKFRPRTVLPRLPCLFQVNSLTELYSIPRHNQVQPPVFMLCTVPVLFGMMFSDIGHGLMLLVLACWLRLGVLVQLMGFMSIYCGAIYNQFFGMKVIRSEHLGILQPQWGVAENGLNFENSLKMKISMMVALLHISFGLGLKMLNEYKRNQLALLAYDSLPKMLLLLTTVGYLNYLVVVKWLTDYSGKEAFAPSVINTILQLYMGSSHSRQHSILGQMAQEEVTATLLRRVHLFCFLVLLYNHTVRHRVQQILLHLWLSQRRDKYKELQEDREAAQDISEQLQVSSQQSNEILSRPQRNYYEEEEPESQLGPLDIFEFILSLISSTTSYLRLFALSLAHAKLSHLLLTFLVASLQQVQPSVSLLRCLVFFVMTVAMMLLLDGMQCIMHVVRLHWVEWMGKFYTGSGVLFRPQIDIHIR